MLTFTPLEQEDKSIYHKRKATKRVSRIKYYEQKTAGSTAHRQNRICCLPQFGTLVNCDGGSALLS